MGIKRKNPYVSNIGPMENPYIESEQATISACYEKYLADPTRKLYQGGRIYYKVFHRCPFRIHNDNEILVFVENAAISKYMGIVHDELGHSYTVRGVEMPQWRSAERPLWYSKANGFLISGDTANLGEYLTNTDERVCRCVKKPKHSNFRNDDYYRWTVYDDSMLVLDDAGNEWYAPKTEFFDYFVIEGSQADIIRYTPPTAKD